MPRRSRRALFDKFVPPGEPAIKGHTRKTTKQFDTPPDIVMQTPSTIEKSKKKLETRKQLLDKKKSKKNIKKTKSREPSSST